MDRGPGVFISYRRNDTKWVAATLASSIKRYLPQINLFLDVVNIEPGLDFENVLNATVDQADIQLVLMGTHWLTSQDKAGRRRIDLEDDWVRSEIERALSRNIRVIPVLVDGAAMPNPEYLPASIKDLSKRQSYSVHYEDHEFAILGILRMLSTILKLSLADSSTTPLAVEPVTQSSATSVLDIFEENSTDNKTLSILSELQLDKGQFGLAKEIFSLVAVREFNRCCGRGGLPDIDACRARYFVGKAKLLEGDFSGALDYFTSIFTPIDWETDTSYPLYIRTQIAIARTHLEMDKVNSAKSSLPSCVGVLFRDQSLTAVKLWIAYLEKERSSQEELMSLLNREIEEFPPTAEFARSLARLKETMAAPASKPTMVWHP